jgi:hypothetical protein
MDEKTLEKYNGIMAKLPEDDQSALLLVTTMHLYHLLHGKDDNEITQGELFPLFKPSKFVELKKDFALNLGSMDKIEKEHKHLLKERLTSGLTLQEHLNKVRNWFNSLSGDDLGNWIKLFAYVKSVKEFANTENDLISFREVSPGRYCFSIKQNKDFFSFFIRPDKKSGFYTTKAKARFLKWLHDNQRAIEFPIIMNGKVWNLPLRIYEYAENVSDKEIFFVVDTNILESEFKEYMSINISEIDHIGEEWEAIAEKNPLFSRTGYRLNQFVDVPLKFLLTLKTSYNREGDYTNPKTGFKGNILRLSKETLNARMGDMGERVRKHLMKGGKVRTGKTAGQMLGEVESLLYETVFEIALKRDWLMSKPKYEKDVFTFNLNAGYFDRKHTAKRIKAPKKS